MTKKSNQANSTGNTHIRPGLTPLPYDTSSALHSTHPLVVTFPSQTITPPPSLSALSPTRRGSAFLLLSAVAIGVVSCSLTQSPPGETGMGSEAECCLERNAFRCVAAACDDFGMCDVFLPLKKEASSCKRISHSSKLR